MYNNNHQNCRLAHRADKAISMQYIHIYCSDSRNHRISSRLIGFFISFSVSLSLTPGSIWRVSARIQIELFSNRSRAFFHNYPFLPISLPPPPVFPSSSRRIAKTACFVFYENLIEERFDCECIPLC